MGFTVARQTDGTESIREFMGVGQQGFMGFGLIGRRQGGQWRRGRDWLGEQNEKVDGVWRAND
jgi:hypothetical protein